MNISVSPIVDGESGKHVTSGKLSQFIDNTAVSSTLISFSFV